MQYPTRLVLNVAIRLPAKSLIKSEGALDEKKEDDLRDVTYNVSTQRLLLASGTITGLNVVRLLFCRELFHRDRVK